MKRRLILPTLFGLIAAWGLFPGCRAASAPSDTLRLYDLQRDEVVEGQQAISMLQQARIILVGEQHNNPAHHRAQLEIIKSLHRSGAKVAVGLEMFRRENQSQLNRWVAGEVSEAEFEPVYLDNWNFDWQLYRPIFMYARQQDIPMVGLNVPRQITRQVARHGFESLSEEQKGALENITCDVTEEYRRFINQAYGAHGHGGMQFERFCEAQMVWDTAMALNAARFLKENPQYTLVIVAGSGHARKMGIPARLREQAPWPVQVVMPETPGIFDPQTLDAGQADWLYLNP